MSDEEWLDFESYGLHPKIREFWKEKKTGVLNCEIKGYEKTLFIRDGVVTFAASEDPGDKLPQVLMNQGRFDEAQLEGVQSRFKPELSVGRNLVEVGLITQQELVAGAKRQVYEIFADALNAESGRCAFQERDLPEGVVNLPLKFPAQFLQALLGMEDKAWIREQIGDFAQIPASSDKKPLNWAQAGLPETAAAVYDLIDGERDINHLVIEADVNEFELFKLLYAFRLLDFIRFQPAAAEGDEASPVETTDPEPVGEPIAEETPVAEQNPESEPEAPEPEETFDENVGEVLRDAIAQDEKVRDLNQGNLDETVMLEPPPELQAGALDLDEAEPAPADEDIEAEWNAAEPPPKAEEDAAELASSEAEPVTDEASESDGAWDELNDDAEDLLKKELEAMQPSGGFEEIGSWEEVDETTDETQDESDVEGESEAEDATPAKKRPLALLIGAPLIAAGLVIILLTQTNAFNLSGGGTEPAPPAGLEQDLVAFESDAAEPAAEAESTAEPESQDAEPEAEAGAAPAEDALNDDIDPNRTAANDAMNAAPDPDAPQPDEEPEPPAENPIASSEKDPDPIDASQPSRPPIALRSPVAEGWDPGAGRPPGEPASDVAKRPKVASNRPAARTSDERRPEPKPTRNETKPVQTAAAPEAQTAPPAEAPSETRRSPREWLKDGDLQEAAQSWRDQLRGQGDRHTLAVFMLCDLENVRKAVALAGDDDRFFLLPRVYNGRNCFWICWGRYDSRAAAMRDFDTLPAAWREQPQSINIDLLSRYLGQ